MKEWTEISALRVEAATVDTVRLAVPREIRVTLTVNGERLRTFVCSPGYERELAAGHLVTMGYVGPGSALVALHVTGDDDKLVDAVLSSPGDPSVAGPTTLSHPNGGTVAPDVLHHAADITYSQGELYSLTRGAHAAALFDRAGLLVAMAEDIGRYNAVDKVVGRQFLASGHLEGLFLVVTCRVSLEMVEKIVRADVPLVLTKAPPTDRAINAAQRLGLAVVHRNAQRELFTLAGPALSPDRA